ncbi:four helix bundle protein [Flagellimonas sp. 389]|uniref:four helix bundle protein n=1 Tax=Flagellimonas sp. 389 TaxID=2835862 RepID=UPI001BD455D1|nr:four helix bundle protein [Flagellimonas sp. 389]MBS9464073.1 four helix bundle protein [Flagellimonas sp. 389]
MNSIHFSFEDLKVYQKALDFVDDVYELCKKFPKEETYRLTSQFIRASTSIALNIAEGAGDTNAQFNRFLQIAIGSIKESVVCITIARRQEYILSKEEVKMKKQLVELSKMLASLQKYLKKEIKN